MFLYYCYLFLIEAISDVKAILNLKQQKLLEHYTTMNQVKQDWDLLNAQHQNLSQRYLPNNIEVEILIQYLTIWLYCCI